MEIETHPLEPFLPAKSKLLMLGSFPPQKKRWSMDFYYPNLNNDMWRIYGILFFNDKNHFLNSTLKSFCREQIIDFLNEKGIALFDTASSIRPGGCVQDVSCFGVYHNFKVAWIQV